MTMTLTTLKATLRRLAQPDRAPRVAVLGIGNALNGDDGAGPAAARALAEAVAGREDVLVLDSGTAPENETGALRRFAPDLVLFLDAAQMDAPPGTVRWVPFEAMSGVGASTHALPPSLLATYLRAELGCEVALLGIQPAGNAMDTPLSPPVRAAVSWLVSELGAALAAGS